MNILILQACYLAEQEAHKSLRPIIGQLNQRIVYIMNRQLDVVETILAKRSVPGRHVSLRLLPNKSHSKQLRFTHYVKEICRKFLDKMSDLFLQKCYDEFYSTATLYYGLSQ